jgi:hypothetical protein
MKHGFIKFEKCYLTEPKYPDFYQENNFEICNNKLDDEPLCLSSEQMYLLLELLGPIQAEAINSQNYIDSNPATDLFDENDGPCAPVISTQKIMFVPCGEDSRFVRAITWDVGSRMKLTLEAHSCSFWDSKRLTTFCGVVEIDLWENLEMIKTFVDECIEMKML